MGEHILLLHTLILDVVALVSLAPVPAFEGLAGHGLVLENYVPLPGLQVNLPDVGVRVDLEFLSGCRVVGLDPVDHLLAVLA